jgi:leucyl aminopeptidase
VLADLPSNLGTPEHIVRRMRPLARKAGLSMRVISRAQAHEHGMGLFCAVDRGAENPGCILLLEHARARASTLPTLAFVGKGLCHDTGGYNLKIVPEIHQLTYDKSGAAAVCGAMLAIAELDLKAHVVAACPLAENVVDAAAFKPGDVIEAYDGTSVYIENTDAEGRLVLADVIAYLADEYDPDVLVDVATLTGAAHVALGEPFAALFSNDDDARDLVLAAAAATGENVWPMPIHDVHDREITHHKADIKNVGVRGGGSCSAAAFLRHFAVGRWAHLDIAGKAFTETPRDYYGIGATGFGCRLLVDVARRFADEWELQ